MRLIAKSPAAAVVLLILSAAFLVTAIPHFFTVNETFERFGVNVLYEVLMIAAGIVIAARARHLRGERLAWLLIGLAIVLWGIGDVIWTEFYEDLASPPYPSISDAFWLAIYPPLYAGLVLLVRSRSGIVRKSLWLDGVIGGLAVGSVPRGSSSSAMRTTR